MRSSLLGPDPVLRRPAVDQLDCDVRRPEQRRQPRHHLGQQPVGDVAGFGRRLEPLPEPGQRPPGIVRLAVHPLVDPALHLPVGRHQQHRHDRGRDHRGSVVAPSSETTLAYAATTITERMA